MKEKLKRFGAWIISPRTLKRALVGFVVLVTLAALFYTEEDWRGAQIWAQTKANLEAQGVSFDPNTYIPKPIPDAENFCKTPLLANLFVYETDPKTGDKVISGTSPSAQTFKAMKGEIIRDGKPLKTPYSLGTEGKKTDFNAWKVYYQQDPEFSQAHPNISGAEAILLYQARNESAWNELAMAVQKKQSRFPIDFWYHSQNRSPFVITPLPAWILNASLGAQAKASAEIATSQPKKALTTMRIALKFAEASSHEPLLIYQILNLAVVSTQLRPMWEVLESRSLQQEDLDSLESMLSAIQVLKNYHDAMVGEVQFCVIRTLDYYKTASLINRWSFFTVTDHPLFPYIPSGWFDLEKHYYVRLFYEYLIPAIDPEQRRYFPEARSRATEYLSSLSSFSSTTAFVKSSGRYLTGHADIFYEVQTRIDMTRIACALESYYLSHHHYPPALDILHKPLPHDLISGEPYRYQLTPDGRYKLWSVGKNKNSPLGQIWSYTPDSR